MDDYLKDDEPENGGLTEQTYIVKAQVAETILPTPLPPLVT